MSQKFMFDGHWLTSDQIKAIKARRDKEAKKAEEEANKPVSEMNKTELKEALTGFEVDFSDAKTNDDLRELLNDYLESNSEDTTPSDGDQSDPAEGNPTEDETTEENIDK